MLRRSIFFLIIATCAACSREATEPANESAIVNQSAVGSANQASEAIQPGEPGGLPDDRNLVEEGPIDPKSAQGAGQVLQSYAALLEQGRFAEARRLWSDGGQASGMDEDAFALLFGKYAEVHAEIGAPGQMEGAAGSAYVDIPVRFYGKRQDGSAFSAVGTATLKRVNDVPGSTEAQRRWHISRVDVQPPL
ncbi:MAG TPA: hypothetical protein VGD23_07995 [Sphingomicrobium sp.]